MNITADMVKILRDKTGAGMMDCKKALQESEGDMEKAIDYLRKKGAATAEKRMDRAAHEGVVLTKLESGRGIIIEVNCETDFVARTDVFKTLVRDLAMQIAAACPISVSPDDVPAELVAKEREILTEQAKASGKPEKIIEKMVEGRIQKYYEEVCLLEQKFVKEQDRAVKEIINDAIAKLGENIRVRRFARFQLGK